jgi:acyl dehydratase
MHVFADFEAVKRAVGAELGVSEWVVVSQERINLFAEATGDDQWIHVDVERARRELPGGRTLAHGLLTLSLVPAFFRSVLRIDGLQSSLNYGSNRVRYITPVPAGSRLRGWISIAEASEEPPEALRVTYRTTVEIEGESRPACVAETIALHRR